MIQWPLVIYDYAIMKKEKPPIIICFLGCLCNTVCYIDLFSNPQKEQFEHE